MIDFEYNFSLLIQMLKYVLVPVLIAVIITSIIIAIFTKKIKKNDIKKYNYAIDFWTSLFAIIIIGSLLAVTIGFAISLSNSIKMYNLVDKYGIIYYLVLGTPLVPLGFLLAYVCHLVKIVLNKPKKEEPLVKAEDVVPPPSILNEEYKVEKNKKEEDKFENTESNNEAEKNETDIDEEDNKEYEVEDNEEKNIEEEQEENNDNNEVNVNESEEDINEDTTNDNDEALDNTEDDLTEFDWENDTIMAPIYISENIDDSEESKDLDEEQEEQKEAEENSDEVEKDENNKEIEEDQEEDKKNSNNDDLAEKLEQLQQQIKVLTEHLTDEKTLENEKSTEDEIEVL